MAFKTWNNWFGAAVVALSALAAGPLLAKDLVVVQIGPLVDQAVPAVVQLGEGMQAMFTGVNARGGLQGDRISFVQLDDGGDPQRFTRQFEAAMKRNPLAVMSPFGSPTVHALLGSKLLDHSDTVVINAVPGAEAFRKPGHPRLFHVRAGDGQQIDRIIDHVHTLGVSRLGLVYVDAPGGYSELASTNEAAQRAGGMTVNGFKAAVASDSIAEATRRLVASDAQAALVLGPPSFLIEGVASLRRQGFTRAIFTLSYLTTEALEVLGPGQSRGIGISQAFPNPNGVVLPVQREFQSAMRAAFPNMKRYTAFQLEGYLSARLLVEASRQARHISPEDIARTLHSMGETNLGGFHVDFSHGNAGSRFVDIGVVNEAGRLTY